MKKAPAALFAVLLVTFLGWAWYHAFCVFPETDPAAILDHRFTGAAYAVAWAIQLSYLAWLGYLAGQGCKEQAQKRAASRSKQKPIALRPPSR